MFPTDVHQRSTTTTGRITPSQTHDHSTMTGLTLSDKVTLGAALLGGAAGVVGSFAVLRRRSLMGDMLAHASLPGVCLAFAITESRNLVGLSIGALVSGLAAITLVTLVTRLTRTKEDAAIGIALSAFFGLGIVLLSAVTRSRAGGNSAGLNSYLLGEPGNMVDSDLWLLSAVGATVLGVVLLLYKEFKLVAFDPQFARSQGWPTLAIDLGMMAAVAVVTIIGLPIVGVILMAAMIILPAATARLWTNRLNVLLAAAGAIGAGSAALGVRLSRGLPTGPTIVLTGTALFLLSLLLAPGRGVLARIVAETQLRLRIGRENLLRSFYELNEPALPGTRLIAYDELRADRHWQPWLLRWLLEQSIRRGLIERRRDSYQLSPLGTRRAAEAAKTHRMWEIYMMEFAGSAADHVDRSADTVEHLLPEGVVAALEQRLAAEGRLPAIAADVPASPHAM
ncbi:MAG: iron ABC transporter [Planctomycetota bacterium]|nr:MAG: iron ABC transporter [Planctomycetota bacterium]